MTYYVVTQPEAIKGIYGTWDECKAKVEGVKGARHQKVSDLAQAQRLLEGGVVLDQGLHVFTDGNHHGGVGVVVVWMTENPQDEPTVVSEIATSVGQIFYGGVVPALGSDGEVQAALQKSRNILAELGGLFLALWQAPTKASLTIVHDYRGVAAWMTGEWKTNEPVLSTVLERCKEIVKDKGLKLRFQWQKGHTSSWAGRHDLPDSTPALMNSRGLAAVLVTITGRAEIGASRSVL